MYNTAHHNLGRTSPLLVFWACKASYVAGSNTMGLPGLIQAHRRAFPAH
jgi:hypothetical protein